jgi:hypothetical protein
MNNTKLHLEMLSPDVYCIVADDAEYLCKVFVRLQEFYESPYPEIRGHWFSLDFFKSIYSKDKDGKFTYYEDWAGFNIPGHVVLKFFTTFIDLSPKEKQLKKLLQNALKSTSTFYVIGVPKGDKRVITHEFAHALYHISSTYKKSMLEISKKLPPKIRRIVFGKLKQIGYDKTVMYDELQAFFATGKINELRYFFGDSINLDMVKGHRKIFRKYENYKGKINKG